MKDSKVYDRVRGALYGVAVGDALGGPLEFMSEEEIANKHGRVTEMIGGGWLRLEPGEITDDTQMTMCVANGVAESPDDPVPAVGRRFIAWAEGRPKDIGAACARSIYGAMSVNANSREVWMRISKDVDHVLYGKTAGNGALMRTLFPALYYKNAADREKKVRDIAKMTHWSDESANICVYYCNAIRTAISGKRPFKRGNPMYYKNDAQPTGYVRDTWSNAVDSFRNSETFEAAVVDAVNKGGDADTIGAIAGGLAGSYYGYSAIPERWINCLDDDLKREMDKLAEIARNEAW